jgi:hypothetical protein
VSGGLDDMRVSPLNHQVLLDTSFEYGKLYREIPEKREEIRDRWEKFCETFVGSGLQNFEILDEMRQQFKRGCFANFWS